MNIVVNLNKDHGITSHDAVTSVKKLFKVAKAGHAGTLDPIATGVLLLCLNEATKITGYLSDMSKEYIMTAKLGESTDTYDSEGRVIKKVADFNITKDDLNAVIQKFVGEIEQTPPMYSAVKLNGKPLYKLARKGIEVKRKPKKVTISSIEMLKFESPFVTLKVACSKGTYIRSLCNDMGNALGVGAYMTELTRTKIGDFMIEDSAKIVELPHKITALHSIDSALRHLSEVRLKEKDLKGATRGNPIMTEVDKMTSTFVRLKCPDGKLLGIGKITGDSIRIKRLLRA